MREVDIVLERDDGMIASIEVKASATVKASDFSGLRACANRLQSEDDETPSPNCQGRCQRRIGHRPRGCCWRGSSKQ